MTAEQVSTIDPRGLAIDTLNRNPDATFDHVRSRLQGRLGRALDAAEVEELRAAYDEEVAHPTGGHRVTAAEALEKERKARFSFRPLELVAIALGLIPFVFRMESRTAESVTRSGAVTPATFYDFSALIGGVLVVLLALAAYRAAREHVTRQTEHYALCGLIILLGLFQTLYGLGVLHKVGLFSLA